MAATSSLECGDFLEFQDAMQKMRQIDDKIIYMLNTTIPTESFRGQTDPTMKCKDLYQQLHSGHVQREAAIKTCLETARERVKKLKNQKDVSESTDLQLIKNLRKEQNKLRLLEAELVVEDIVKQRTRQVYHEKCRSYYKPPDTNL